MDDVTGNFVFFVLLNTARGFENVCEIISDKTSESLQKSLAGAIYKEEKGKKGKQKEFLTTWECLNCKKSSQCTIATVCHCYERLVDNLQNIFAIILLWASEGIKKLFGETV